MDFKIEHMSKRPFIFVTNDDGIHASGISELIGVAREFGDVVAIAPSQCHSGMSHSITMNQPLFVNTISKEKGLEVYSCSGTPVDCVKIGFDEVFKERMPDLVLSGINHGSNANVSVIYSGTMGAATEAALYGVPALGFSLTDHSLTADFTGTVQYARQIVDSIIDKLEDEEMSGLCLNINVPNIPAEELKGVRICRQTRGNWREDFVKRNDPQNRDYYWMAGRFYNFESHAEDTDEWALRNGYVSVVPVKMDLTDYNRMETLNNLRKQVSKL